MIDYLPSRNGHSAGRRKKDGIPQQRERFETVSLRNIEPKLWKEALAQARLQGMTLSQWTMEAFQAHLLSESVLRSKVTVERCEMCGVKFDTNHKRIMHHDEPNTREAGVVKVLCSKCHRIRHQELGWGFPGRPQRFKCPMCKNYYNVNRMDARVWHSPETGKKVNLCVLCTADVTKILEWFPTDTSDYV